MEECRRCAANSTSNRTRHLFKTIVLVALAYICFIETNTRLAVQNYKTHFSFPGAIPYCKSYLIRACTIFCLYSLSWLLPSSRKSCHPVYPSEDLAGRGLVSIPKKAWAWLGCVMEWIACRFVYSDRGFRESSWLRFNRTDHTHLQRGDESTRRKPYRARGAHGWWLSGYHVGLAQPSLPRKAAQNHSHRLL